MPRLHLNQNEARADLIKGYNGMNTIHPFQHLIAPNQMPLLSLIVKKQSSLI
jgi:hypothetical protein